MILLNYARIKRVPWIYRKAVFVRFCAIASAFRFLHATVMARRTNALKILRIGEQGDVALVGCAVVDHRGGGVAVMLEAEFAERLAG